MRWRLILLAVAVVATNLHGVAAVDFPKPSGAINDFAGVLDASTKASLMTLVEAVERETTAEIAVATVTTLEGMSVEEYANRLFKAWGVGQKARDNGVLLLVAPKERTMRIEVGYGLEPILPDGLAGSIVREDVLPQFRGGDYPAGITKGVERVAAIIRKKEMVNAESSTPAAPLVQTPPADVGFAPEWVVIFIGAAWIGFAMFEAGVAVRAQAMGPIAKDLVMTAPVLWLAPRLVANSLYLLVPVAAIMLPIGYLVSRKRRAWRNAARGRHGRRGWVWGSLDAMTGSSRSGSDWSSGSDSSSGSSSDGSSGDSSFGGGSAGGGGATGSW